MTGTIPTATQQHGPESGPPEGLSTAEAQRRLGEVGPNRIAETAPPRWRIFLAKLWGPVPWLLELATVLQLGLGQYVEAAVVVALILFNATLGFIQEGRAGAALAALKKRLAPTALALRDGAWVRLPAADIVSGDIVALALGALVPADATIVSGAVLIDQSALTGESVSVDANPGNQVYAGALIRRGQAVARVTATGAGTYFGRTAELVRTAHSANTEQAAIFAVTRNLVIVNGAVTALLVILAYAMGLSAADQISLALTALLATIPLGLPMTFSLSAAFGAQVLARHGVLLTRLSAAHEAASMDVLCVDKTGTLTRNALEVVEVVAMASIERDRVLALAALASSEGDQDPIDAAVRAAAAQAADKSAHGRLARFVPFDPATRMSESVAVESDGTETHIAKGAPSAIATVADISSDARRQIDSLAEQGHRVIAVGAGPGDALRLVGLIALSDPPRDDSAKLVTDLNDLGVRTVMVTGDSALTAATIARAVGIAGPVCPPERITDEPHLADYGVFARIVPEEKFRLVTAFQSQGHVVGMCGDGVNDAPALRQAQIGIAVSSATDAAKAAAGMVMTEPGLAGVVFAIREGRIGFRRIMAYTFSMLVKKTEIVLFLAIGLATTGHAVLTPTLMVLMFMTNDFLSMSLTTDRGSPARSPGQWHMRNITLAALTLGFFKLAFSTAVLAIGKFGLGLGMKELQTLAFVTLVLGNQSVLFVVRERRRIWSSRPSIWVMLSSGADIAIVSILSIAGLLMAPLPMQLVAAIFGGAVALALLLDAIKAPLMAALRIA